jgi:hypothetical protein
MLQGWSVPQIAEHVSISQCSVRTYMERALTKIGVASKSELFAWCVTVEQRHRQLRLCPEIRGQTAGTPPAMIRTSCTRFCQGAQQPPDA